MWSIREMRRDWCMICSVQVDACLAELSGKDKVQPVPTLKRQISSLSGRGPAADPVHFGGRRSENTWDERTADELHHQSCTIYETSPGQDELPHVPSSSSLRQHMVPFNVMEKASCKQQDVGGTYGVSRCGHVWTLLKNILAGNCATQKHPSQQLTFWGRAKGNERWIFRPIPRRVPKINLAAWWAMEIHDNVAQIGGYSLEMDIIALLRLCPCGQIEKLERLLWEAQGEVGKNIKNKMHVHCNIFIYRINCN